MFHYSLCPSDWLLTGAKPLGACRPESAACGCDKGETKRGRSSETALNRAQVTDKGNPPLWRLLRIA